MYFTDKNPFKPIIKIMVQVCMEDHYFCVSDSSQFDYRSRYSVLIFVMAKALCFSPPLSYAVLLHSVLPRHFLYHMYRHVVCYNSLCFLPLLKFFILFGIVKISLDVNFIGCVCIANFYLSEV